jgi:hypothetical protein
VQIGGGGVRALYQLYFLKQLMEKIALYERKTGGERNESSSADSPLFHFRLKKGEMQPNKPRLSLRQDTYLPCHYFDYIGGTGIGG